MTREKALVSRVERLEALVERQGATIEAQRERIEELEAAQPNPEPEHHGVSRRTTLKAGGLAGLLALGAGTAGADSQGQVGTSEDPIETLYAAGIEGPLTDGVRLDSLVGDGLAVSGGKLTIVIDVASLNVAEIAVPSVDVTDTFAVDVTVEETAGVQTEGLTVSLEISNGDEHIDQRTIAPPEIQGDSAVVTVGDGSPFERLEPGEYTATVTVDATNAEPATGSESFAVDTPFPGGDGTSQHPYEIATWHHLDDVRHLKDDAFVQTADLDSTTDGYDAVASGTANGGDGFDPIGSFGDPFTGSFDGDGHVLAGLTIDRDGETEVGLFGANAGSIERVGLEGATVSGSSSVGGLVGYNDGEVAMSLADGDVEGGESVGGLVGWNDTGGVVERSFATAAATASGDFAGGFVGQNIGGDVSRCYAMGPVDGDQFVGGFVGNNTETIEESYATGTVTATSAPIGGFAGSDPGSTAGSYWDHSNSPDLAATDGVGEHSSSGVTGLATADMQGDDLDAGFEADFDFATTWATVTGPDGYPVLQAIDEQTQLEARG